MMRSVRSILTGFTSLTGVGLLSLLGVGLMPGTAQAWNANVTINSGPVCNVSSALGTTSSATAGLFNVTLNGTEASGNMSTYSNASYNNLTPCGYEGSLPNETFDNYTEPTTGFLFWCTDITMAVATGTNSYLEYTYTYPTSPSGNPGTAPSTTKANELNALLYNGQGVLAATASAGQAVIAAAIQLAVWAIYYDSNVANYTFSSGEVFNVTGGNGTAQSDALAFLACVVAGQGLGGTGNSFCTSAGWAPTSTDVFDFHQNTAGYGQSYQSVAYLGADNSGMTSSGNSGSLPEPASLALLGSGLAGLAVLRRRRRS